MTRGRRLARWALFLLCDFLTLYALAWLLAGLHVTFWPRLGIDVAAGVVLGVLVGVWRVRR